MLGKVFVVTHNIFGQLHLILGVLPKYYTKFRDYIIILLQTKKFIKKGNNFEKEGEKRR